MAEHNNEQATLNYKLQPILDERGISLREFARRTETRDETVRNFAHGTIKRIPVDFLAKACRELGCGVSDLVEVKPAEEADT